MRSGEFVFEIKLCNCLDEKPSHTVKAVFPEDKYCLNDGGHTSFIIFKCKECFGFCGMPPGNFDLALKSGTFFTRFKILSIIGA